MSQVILANIAGQAADSRHFLSSLAVTYLELDPQGHLPWMSERIPATFTDAFNNCAVKEGISSFFGPNHKPQFKIKILKYLQKKILHAIFSHF